MTRSKGDMASPRFLLTLMATLHYIASINGGPLGPLPNITSAEMGLKEGSCALGDVVYMSGDQFPGSSPCERCTCSAGGVQCAQQQCEPRPGCKALHRPDHCCPTYQCECQQEGRVYRNGEKLVDPLDPCRVCYCQGGEVVCRRIACFVRDDCTPRRVPGRCCPEYDNCPIRGVTSLPGVTIAPSISPVDQVEAVPSPPKEVKQEFTIKEITPVSEIPIITDVKIKEILPSTSVEAAEYSSSKSPLIPREATSEKSDNFETTKTEPEGPSVVEVHPSSETSSPEVMKTTESKEVDDLPPSKFSLSTLGSIHSEIYPSNMPIVITMGAPPSPANSPAPAPAPASAIVTTTTKSHIMEDDDPSLFVDHNPAFPPLPDDLSVLSNHGDEIVPEPSVETDHIPLEHSPSPEVIVASVTPSTQSERKEHLTTTTKYFPDTTVTTTEKSSDLVTEMTNKVETTASTSETMIKENPIVNLRSAISSEIVTIPTPETSTRGHEETPSTTVSTREPLSTITSKTTDATTSQTSTTTAATFLTSTATVPTTVISTTDTSTQTTLTSSSDPFSIVTSTATAYEPSTFKATMTEGSKSIEDISIEDPAKLKTFTKSTTDEPTLASKEMNVPEASEEMTTDEPEIPIQRVSFFVTSTTPDSETTTLKGTESSTTEPNSVNLLEHTTISIPKSNIPTEVTSHTELSSLPIETSDQNPHEAAENVSKDTLEASTGEPLTTIGKLSPSNSEVITVAKANGNSDNIETTEFILTALGSSESATDAELIKIAGDSDKSADIVDSSEGKNALTDLIKLVNDMSSISHTESPSTGSPSTIADDSEELIPVNAGYKSKNSNFNQNSITEVPSFKSKSGAPVIKQKVMEIEDDDDSITDSSALNDKVEPTTRRPIIDNVSATDNLPEMKTEKKDIEIIPPKSYVPPIIRRPTKVVLKEDKPQELTSADSEGATTLAPTAQ